MVSGDPDVRAEIARLIRARIKEVTGLNASAGISYNKFLAKIASDLNKPDGLFVLRPEQVAEFVGRLRSQPFANAFQRAPGIAESVEWAKALVALDTLVVDPEVVSDTAGILFKQREDVAALTADMATQLLKPLAAEG